MVEANPLNEPVSEHPDLDVLLFRLDRELYAIPSASVREVARYRQYTPVPGASPVLPGIISQRGMILPIVALHLLLGLGPIELTRSARFVIVVHNEIGMAILVEAVLDLIALPARAVEPVPAALDPALARFLRGIAQHEDRPIGLLDPDEIIAALREKE
jgi:purine-binding chemotaxis protein CheW